ncbi:efflux RND transporter periplasmic adaptor subunit [Paracoccus sp. CPCC 101403]|uniref:Efflux RND transporter periplasmic adaptor subunit n=1 Tax=Paracoccus broussonetiae TaxID=3075834 RepID=A0ABU3EGC7_9RHOB|nr:efflux RND transporter periplasmic adaptor subunit [Paracoccus sp. CPCC 101403]MDT1063297.1 efflux RND transporter periplasmic adaptor subunit [Paracoccus sp. CPCC 101403]
MQLVHVPLLVAALAVWVQGAPAPAQAQEAAAPVKVQVVPAERRSIRPEFSHPAIIEAQATASVRPLVGGQIVERNVTPGDIVKKGDLLFRIDDREYKFALAEAKAALQLTEAEQSEMKIEFERSRTLVSRGTSAQQELDLAQAKYAAAQAKVASAQVAIDRAQKNLDDTQIHAPFDGRISAAARAVGDFVQPADPTQPDPMAEIVRLDPIYAVGFISQQVYNDFQRRRERMEDQGQDIPDLQIDLILPGGDKYPETGKFVSWDFQAAASRGSIAARAEFANPNGELLPGENVILHGQTVEALDRVVVPQRAVGQDQEGQYVMVVGPDNVVQRRLLELGIRDGADWTVNKGLEQGESVIVEGLQKVRPGATVTPEPFKG